MKLWRLRHTTLRRSVCGVNATDPELECGEPASVGWVFDAAELDRLTAEHDGGNKVKQAAYLDVERSMLHKIKTNQARPNSHTVLKIADRLGVPVERLFQRVES